MYQFRLKSKFEKIQRIQLNFRIFAIPLFLLLGSTHVYALEFDVDWIVEGQTDLEEQTDLPSLESEKSRVMPSHTYWGVAHDNFVTDNEYAIGDYKITIDSEEGQRLNRLLIGQTEMRQDSFLHKIRYHDRFSDGYVQIAEALLNPVGEQLYLVQGRSYDHYPRSNLEYFVLERGYSLDDLESVPNDIFSPAALDTARKTIADSNRYGGLFDLRDLSPNYMRMDEDAARARMVDTISDQTLRVYTDIVDQYRTHTFQESTVEIFPSEQVHSNMFDDLVADEPRFESTRHVREIRHTDVTIPVPVQAPDTFKDQTDYVLLVLIPIVGLSVLGYLLRHRLATRFQHQSLQVIKVATGHSITTHDLLDDSMLYYRNNMLKDAHEILGRAIRHHYSNRLGIDEDLTNLELLLVLKKSNDPQYLEIRELLLLCGSVGYARYRPTSDDFLEAHSKFSSLIS